MGSCRQVGQPVAAVAFECNADHSQVSTYNLLASGATTLYAPVIKKNSSPAIPQSTGLRIQNLGASTASITVTYYDSASSNVYTSATSSIPANGAVTLYNDPVLPSPFLGSAKVTSTQQIIVAEVHETGTVRKMASSADNSTTSKVTYAPRACNSCTMGGLSFVSGIRVQNAGSATANITIKYYDSLGSQVGTETISNLGANRAQNAVSIPVGLSGSAVITADQPIVAVVNLANSDTGKDLTMTYNAPNR